MTLHSTESFRSGFVALAGRPNVGKSTLLNCLVDEKIAIVSHRAQTTRKQVRGIINRPNSQIIFVDTPGLHLHDVSTKAFTSKKPLAINRYMIREARSAIQDVDIAVLLVEAQGRGRDPRGAAEDRMVLELFKKITCKRFLVINKIDALKKKPDLLHIIDAYHSEEIFEEIMPLSAKTGEGVDLLCDVIETYLPQGPRYFPESVLTDEPERVLAAEYIREQVFLQSDQEVPYGTAVEIDSFEELPHRDLVRIHAQIYVERKSQKGILIGHGGSRLKSIGTEARKSIERLLGCKVFLELRVKCKKSWTKTEAGIKSVGYTEK